MRNDSSRNLSAVFWFQDNQFWFQDNQATREEMGVRPGPAYRCSFASQKHVACYLFRGVWLAVHEPLDVHHRAPDHHRHSAA